MITPDTTAAAYSQGNRMPSSRSGSGSGEFDDALSSVEGDRNAPRDGHARKADKHKAEDEVGSGEAGQSGQSGKSRLDLSYLRAGATEAAQANLPAGSGSDVAVLSEAERLLLASADPSTIAKDGKAPQPRPAKGQAAEKSDEAAAATDGKTAESAVPSGSATIGMNAQAAMAAAMEGAAAATPQMPAKDEAGTKAAAQDAVATLLTGLAAAQGLAGQAGQAGQAGMDGRANSRGQASTSRTDAVQKAGREGKDEAIVDGQTLSKDVIDGLVARDGVEADREKRSFQLTSAQDGRRSMSMTIGTDSEGKASFETGKKAAAGADTITVLDSRRFLGFTQSLNGSALASAMSSDPGWQSAMQADSELRNTASQNATKNVVNTLKLQMTPIDLGTVTATLRLAGEALTVHLTVETRAAQKQLSDDSSGILGALRAQGFSVDQVTVSVAPAQQGDQTATGDGQQRSMDPNAQQGQMQQQGQASSGQSRTSGGTNEHDAAVDTRSSSPDGGRSSGGLYL
ncbi:flagellar hook-length control protein FliK [Rhizobium sp. SSA_523]|uniref:flagellar hook-length control protein FliK n=1 Tax=Rhizobium sp. SSA_523 TaxID=2952477 RepID=UPI002090CC81|nr:flagellar hook-length control protein FliK [Rhizobium sp. SSA_523]MCO5733031.1 flagellar hook-length control protein FliK [Rhizobium sp. SSA_523]WKC23912.1 flagellar hook-length control protein FliK [Rhizobium sp. SSA_523]